MFIVNLTDKNGQRTVNESLTLTEAKMYCTDNAKEGCKYDVFEMFPNGDMNEVYSVGALLEDE